MDWIGNKCRAKNWSKKPIYLIWFDLANWFEFSFFKYIRDSINTRFENLSIDYAVAHKERASVQFFLCLFLFQLWLFKLYPCLCLWCQKISQSNSWCGIYVYTKHKYMSILKNARVSKKSQATNNVFLERFQSMSFHYIYFCSSIFRK